VAELFARVQVVEELPAATTTPGEVVGPTEVVELVAAHPGFCEAWSMRQLGGPGGVLVSLWATREDAELAPERSAERRGGPRPFALVHDRVYAVRQVGEGPAGDRRPTVSQLTWFDGPRSEAQAAADERAGIERLWPAVCDTPGLVRSLALVADDRSYVHVGLATAAEVLDEVQRRVVSTELLPDEDPALLGGPDRIDVCTVLAGRELRLEA
jgi:hypothetical protein